MFFQILQPVLMGFDANGNPIIWQKDMCIEASVYACDDPFAEIVYCTLTLTDGSMQTLPVDCVRKV